MEIQECKAIMDSFSLFVDVRDQNRFLVATMENITLGISLQSKTRQYLYRKDESMNKVIVFDMDGLMFDTERVFVEAWDYAGEKIGIGKAGYMSIKTMGMSINESRPLWISEFGDKFNEDELRRHTSDFIKDYYSKNKVPTKSGLYELLEYLNNNGFRLGIASSSPRWEIERHLHDAEIFDYFEVIVGGDMVTRSKPHPDLYLLACNLLNVVPNHCIALEDSINGIISAYNAGLKPIMIPDLVQPTEEIEGFLYGKFSSLVEVIDFLEGSKMKTGS